MGVPSKFSLARFSSMLILLTLLGTLPLLSQTVIKEKIKISPKKFNSPNVAKTELTNNEVRLYWSDTTVTVSFWVFDNCIEPYFVPWQKITSFSFNKSGKATGNYGVQIRMNFQRDLPVDVYYSFPTGENGIITIPSNRSGNFSYANIYGYYESINDFYLGFTNGIICDEQSYVRISPYFINNYDCEFEAPLNALTPVSIILESDLDCYLYDSVNQVDYGKSTEIKLGSLKNLEIKLRSEYNGDSRKEISVTVQTGEIIRSRSIIVEGKGSFDLYYYYAENEDEKVLPGEEKLLEVYASSDNYCVTYYRNQQNSIWK